MQYWYKRQVFWLGILILTPEKKRYSNAGLRRIIW